MPTSITTPFFVFNPKSYLYGDALLNLAKVADQLASNYGMSIFVTAPFADISNISENTSNIIVTAQHMDGIDPGRGMGHVLPESLHRAGARATFLNHAENPMILSELAKSIKKAKELKIQTIVCADSIQEAQAIAKLSPDIILCEPTELIGTGQTSDESYIKATNKAIKEINPDILVMQAAGISTAEDVFKTISLGADGTGCTSGIVKSSDPSKMLVDMVESAIKANKKEVK
ncbi:triosephosphate isomerase (TIM) [Halolactibacillus halophilus]|uniref:Triose-phosphate isomerase n=1 Tax=Halolactibacillus halophilus TaxID=306540 RepID=A0A1I5R421_9BACI|nr:triose-phosphate isomerase [Halolactibacillus halophilus]GEM02717.1 triose-phosphate isomerase [Halolactibacillus halophilus]SFP53110.1 triosephosphate isomerase (TIM) [Halolactibacillus halophilus]